MPVRGIDTYKVDYDDNTSLECSEPEVLSTVCLLARSHVHTQHAHIQTHALHSSFQVRSVIHVLEDPEWLETVNKFKVAHDYLQARLTNHCDSPYHCA